MTLYNMCNKFDIPLGTVSGMTIDGNQYIPSDHDSLSIEYVDNDLGSLLLVNFYLKDNIFKQNRFDACYLWKKLSTCEFSTTVESSIYPWTMDEVTISEEFTEISVYDEPREFRKLLVKDFVPNFGIASIEYYEKRGIPIIRICNLKNNDIDTEEYLLFEAISEKFEAGCHGKFHTEHIGDPIVTSNIFDNLFSVIPRRQFLTWLDPLDSYYLSKNFENPVSFKGGNQNSLIDSTLELERQKIKR